MRVKACKFKTSLENSVLITGGRNKGHMIMEAATLKKQESVDIDSKKKERKIKWDENQKDPR